MAEVKPSAELVAITARFERAIHARDAGVLRNLFSGSDSVRYLGTADNELWSGALVRDGFADHVGELPRFETQDVSCEAFECGSVGWSLTIRNVRYSGKDVWFQLRSTLVFALEDGNWKIVHRHASTPRANRDVIGVDHTALDELVAAAKAENPTAGQTGIASIMFTDIANSSAIAAAVGDRAWADIVQRHLKLVSKVIADNNGTLVKSLGDGTMSSFGSTGAALTAAIQVQQNVCGPDTEPVLKVRIGIHTGDVVQAGDDFFGTVVNKAARIAAQAVAGEIRVSDASRTMVGTTGGFTFADQTSVPLRGLEGEHLIFKLEWGARGAA